MVVSSMSCAATRRGSSTAMRRLRDLAAHAEPLRPQVAGRSETPPPSKGTRAQRSVDPPESILAAQRETLRQQPVARPPTRGIGVSPQPSQELNGRMPDGRAANRRPKKVVEVHHPNTPQTRSPHQSTSLPPKQSARPVVSSSQASGTLDESMPKRANAILQVVLAENVDEAILQLEAHCRTQDDEDIVHNWWARPALWSLQNGRRFGAWCYLHVQSEKENGIMTTADVALMHIERGALDEAASLLDESLEILYKESTPEEVEWIHQTAKEIRNGQAVEARSLLRSQVWQDNTERLSKALFLGHELGILKDDRERGFLHPDPLDVKYNRRGERRRAELWTYIPLDENDESKAAPNPYEMLQQQSAQKQIQADDIDLEAPSRKWHNPVRDAKVALACMEASDYEGAMAAVENHAESWPDLQDYLLAIDAIYDESWAIATARALDMGQYTSARCILRAQVAFNHGRWQRMVSSSARNVLQKAAIRFVRLIRPNVVQLDDQALDARLAEVRQYNDGIEAEQRFREAIFADFSAAAAGTETVQHYAKTVKAHVQRYQQIGRDEKSPAAEQALSFILAGEHSEAWARLTDHYEEYPLDRWASLALGDLEAGRIATARCRLKTHIAYFDETIPSAADDVFKLHSMHSRPARIIERLEAYLAEPQGDAAANDYDNKEWARKGLEALKAHDSARFAASVLKQVALEHEKRFLAVIYADVVATKAEEAAAARPSS